MSTCAPQSRARGGFKITISGRAEGFWGGMGRAETDESVVVHGFRLEWFDLSEGRNGGRERRGAGRQPEATENLSKNLCLWERNRAADYSDSRSPRLGSLHVHDLEALLEAFHRIATG